MSQTPSQLSSPRSVGGWFLKSFHSRSLVSYRRCFWRLFGLSKTDDIWRVYLLFNGQFSAPPSTRVILTRPIFLSSFRSNAIFWDLTERRVLYWSGFDFTAFYDNKLKRRLWSDFDHTCQKVDVRGRFTYDDHGRATLRLFRMSLNGTIS